MEEEPKDADRPGSFTLEQITQLYTFACKPPREYGRPISHWTLRELADGRYLAPLFRQLIAKSCDWG